MTSIERTAYPRFKRLITAHELHLFFASSRDEVEWAAARTDCDEHLLAQLLALKAYQRMGCFPKLDEIPDPVVDFVRRAVDLPEGTAPRASNRTAERQRTAVRQRTGLSYDKARARKIAEAVMRSEAVSKNRPADLINIALEKVVEAGLELPGFTTLDALAAKVRTEVNAAICMGIYDQLSEAHRERPLALLSEKDTSGTTKYNRLKQSAKPRHGRTFAPRPSTWGGWQSPYARAPSPPPCCCDAYAPARARTPPTPPSKRSAA
ncbi:DUF4158 domain-containing protein [Streptomyces sp. NPDC048196]|uniref:DUF4158 domain-containing protein n=1 Tax=Streptomyces sp. NPDC048196 TaxID=3154712 RepID=UPI0033C5265E